MRTMLPVRLVFCRVEFFDGKERGEIDDFSVDSVVGGGGTPAVGEDVKILDARSENLSAGGDFRLPESSHREGFGVDVGEAHGVELLLRPFDGVVVVVGAGEARADGVGELAVVVVGLAVDEDVADESGDGGAGFGGDGTGRFGRECRPG